MSNSCFRTKPNFDTEEAYAAISMGVSGILGIIFLFYGLLQGIKNLNLSWVLQALCFIPLIAVTIGVNIKAFKDASSILIKKRTWLKGTTSVRAMIIDREESFWDGGDYESGKYTYHLTLETPHLLTTGCSNQLTVKASVSKRIYNKYAHRDTAHIDYSIENPLVFLIRGE